MGNVTRIMRDPNDSSQWLIYEISPNPVYNGVVWGRTWNDPDGNKAANASAFIMRTGAQPTMEGYATAPDMRWRRW
jgi:hypothetical protein